MKLNLKASATEKMAIWSPNEHNARSFYLVADGLGHSKSASIVLLVMPVSMKPQLAT